MCPALLDLIISVTTHINVAIAMFVVYSQLSEDILRNNLHEKWVYQRLKNVFNKDGDLIYGNQSPPIIFWKLSYDKTILNHKIERLKCFIKQRKNL